MNIKFLNMLNNKSKPHSLQLHPQLVVGEFQGSSDGLEVVY